MRSHRPQLRRTAEASLAGLIALCSSLCCALHKETESSACAQFTNGNLTTEEATVIVGSALRPNGSLRAGLPAPCHGRDAERRALSRALKYWRPLPAALRLSPLRLHYAPRAPAGVRPISTIEVHSATGALLVGPRSAQAPHSVWLHEFAHLAMRGPRPRARIPRRLVAAIEEGIADFVAAQLTGQAMVGGGALPVRNLSVPSRILPAWEQLALSQRYDPHPLGQTLAPLLWEQRLTLQAPEIVSCLRLAKPLETAQTVKEATLAILHGCPTETARALSTIFDKWLPPQLLATSPNSGTHSEE